MTYNLKWLTDKYDRGEPVKYIFFWGHTVKSGEQVGKFVFSQWYYAPFTVDGVAYKTAEHWMMAHKALLFNDQNIFDKITVAATPGEVKALGRQIQGFNDSTWNAHKFDIVTRGNIHKFQQHKLLGDFLKDTGDRVLVEASPVDSIWGIGLAENADTINNPHTWKGENLLGFALMEARDYLKGIQSAY